MKLRVRRGGGFSKNVDWTPWKGAAVCITGVVKKELSLDNDARVPEFLLRDAEWCLIMLGRAMVPAVKRRLLTTKAEVQFQASPREVCGGQGGTETGLFSNSYVFACRHHSTNTPVLFLIRRTSGQSMAAFQKTTLLRKSRSVEQKMTLLLFLPPGVAFKNSTFCPQSVFMCFVWI